MVTPAIPTRNDFDERSLAFLIAECLQAAGTTLGGAPPAIVSRNNFDRIALMYDILLQVKYIADNIGNPQFSDAIDIVNETGGAVTQDEIVYPLSFETDVGDATLGLADANANLPAMYFLAAGGADETVIRAARRGLSAATLNTDAGVIGDPVYLSETPGGWSLTPPSDPLGIVQIIGRIAIKSATVGQIMWDIGGLGKIGGNELEPGIIAATALGRALFGTGIFDTATLTNAIAAGAFTDALVDAIVAAGAIDGRALATGLITLAQADGVDETMVTTYAIAGIAVGDEIMSVVVNTTKAAIGTRVARPLTDFTVGAGLINVVANAAVNTNNQLEVMWMKHQ